MTRWRSSTHVGQAAASVDMVDRQNAVCASALASLMVTTRVRGMWLA